MQIRCRLRLELSSISSRKEASTWTWLKWRFYGFFVGQPCYCRNGWRVVYIGIVFCNVCVYLFRHLLFHFQTHILINIQKGCKRGVVYFQPHLEQWHLYLARRGVTGWEIQVREGSWRVFCNLTNRKPGAGYPLKYSTGIRVQKCPKVRALFANGLELGEGNSLPSTW